MATVVSVIGIALVLGFVFMIVSPALSATHWVVTEDGKIQEQVYSVFQMRRPYDLVALMQQECRAYLIEHFMVHVDNEIELINIMRNIDFSSKGNISASDYDCVHSEKPLSNYNLYASTIATCKELELSLADLVQYYKLRTYHQKLDCSMASELDFSMHAFEHLQAMRRRHSLEMVKDIELREILADYVSDLEVFGEALQQALAANKTSWILYNLAGYYFRMAGNAHHAIECIRRALLFSPKAYKSVAMLNLGNVFHQAKQSRDAAVVVLAAADLEPRDPMVHYTLGNIYAVLEEYDNSAQSFETALKLRSDFEAAALRRHAVNCQLKMEKSLDLQFESLQRTLVELDNFQQRLSFWQKQQDKLIQEQASIESRLTSQIDYAEWTIQQKINHQMFSDGAGLKNSGSVVDKNKDCSPIMPSGSTGQPFIANVKIQLGSTWSHLLEDVEVTAARLKQEAEFNAAVGKSSDVVAVTEQTASRYPRKPHRDIIMEPPPRYLLPDWPSRDDCESHDIWSGPLLTYPAFIPPENKGFKIGKILAKLKFPRVDDGHPFCAIEVDAAHTSPLWDSMFTNLESNEEDVMITRNILREYLSTYSGRYSIEELGFRLKRALADHVAPEWLLYQLTFFYWAAMGDIGNSSRCLVSSSILTPPSFKDISIVPVASILGREGLLIGALHLGKLALQINRFEPATNKLLADLYAKSGDLQNSAVHYKKVLQEDPHYRDALQSYLWVSCQLQRNQDGTVTGERIAKNTLRMNLEETNVGFGNCHISEGNKDKVIFCGGKELDNTKGECYSFTSCLQFGFNV